MPFPGEDPPAASSATFAGKQDAADIFRQLFIACIPPRSYGDDQEPVGLQRLPGFHRMIAVAWVTAPELFKGTPRTRLAAQLGIPQQRFAELCSEARGLLDQSRSEKSAGPSWPPSPVEVPREA